MPSFKLAIITARGKAFDGKAESIVIPGSEGDFGILADHAPLIGALRQGLLKITSDGVDTFFITGEGYVEVAKNEVSILVGEAVRVKDHSTGHDLLRQSDPWEAAEELNNAQKQ